MKEILLESNIKNIPFNSALGINFGEHDSSIAIVDSNGNPIFCASLERYTRIKQDGSPPYNLLDLIPWKKISRVAISQKIHNINDYRNPSKLIPINISNPNIQEFSYSTRYSEFFKKIPMEINKVCHHLSHTSVAFWGSGFHNSLCLTYDGGYYNSPWSGGLYIADKKNGISSLDMFNSFYHSNLAILYSFVTAVLGFRPNKHEGKITGLAAYGKDKKKCSYLINKWFDQLNSIILEVPFGWIFDDDNTISPEMYVDEAVMEKYRIEAIEFSKEDLAASLQKFVENYIVNILFEAKKVGWTNESICLSGGLFSNVKLNQKIAGLGFNNVYIAPAMTDDGTALGAIWATLFDDGITIPSTLRTVYLGPSYEKNHIQSLLESKKIVYEVVPNSEEKIAELLSNGKVIGIFQNNMEFGPRALGNRSIIAPAIDVDINKYLNKKLHRTEFMPFAPITRLEDAAICYFNFENILFTSKFMTITMQCSDFMKQVCPAVVHVDGSARPQFVEKNDNLLLYSILSSYKKLTGIPALINTSFNIHEEPIVCTPLDALKGFFEAGLDYLLFENNILIAYENNKEVALEFLFEKSYRPSSQIKTLNLILKWKSYESKKLNNSIDLLKISLNTLKEENMQLKEEQKKIKENFLWKIIRGISD